MNKEFDAYLKKTPEVVFEWNDSLTDAKGWVVINSLRNGAAGGGTRMRKGLTRDEVLSLAKVMEIKFSVSGPPIGGAKSGIDFDPSDPRKREVLDRWFRAVIPLLKNYYGTGGDLNVDEILDVNPLTEKYGLWHPQEGVVNGHFKGSDGEKVNMIGQLRWGCSKLIEDEQFLPLSSNKKYAIADMVTGYGVAEAVRHYYGIFQSGKAEGKRAIVQGWGNVASASALYLAQQGVKIVGIIDISGGIIDGGGLDYERISELFLNKNGNKLNDPEMKDFDTINEKIWDVGAEIFIPGAASKLVTPEQVDRMMKGGLEVVSCGANVPFIDDGISFGPTAKYADSKVALIPDFIANCGMARAFAYFMQTGIELTDAAILGDVSNIIYKALKEVNEKNPGGRNISSAALSIALNKL
ncbi:MAG: amino acid dehydrogenase [Saprospirales bacterium]|nr:MAG: amino acid dehydrogenase [Saprospirales bacterium]